MITFETQSSLRKVNLSLWPTSIRLLLEYQRQLARWNDKLPVWERKRYYMYTPMWTVMHFNEEKQEFDF